MHVTIRTTDFNAIDILRKFLNNSKVVYESLIIDSDCILTVKNPSSEILGTLSKFTKSLSGMTDVKACVYVDKAIEPLSFEDLNI